MIVLGGLVGLALALLLPKVYSARTELFVAPGTGGTSIELVQGSTFVLDRVKSYVEVVNTDIVLAPVIDELGLDVTVADLAERVSATVITETVVVVIAVEDSSAEQSARIANAIAQEFVRVAPTLEPAGRANSPVIKITVINSASVPIAAERPVLRFNVALGLLIGLAVGLAAAFAREAMDARVTAPRQIAAVSSAPLLVQLPDTATIEDWIRSGTGSGAGVEALRQLRTTLHAALLDRGRASCVITSAVAREGRTTVAAGLARAFGEAGQRVCLVEADLRQPALGSRLGLGERSGLVDVLGGQLNWQDAVRSLGDNAPDVLLAGSESANPPELLANDATKSLLEQLESAYDVVVVDTPPLLAVADADNLAAWGGGAVMVVGSGPSAVTAPKLSEAVARIAAVHGHLFGFAANRFPANR